jgi:voltage-gated potassium channel
LSVEEGNEKINNLEDAIWFSVTTLTISGFGDVYPTTTYGRVVAAVLSFIGLGIILGFISNVGSALVASRLGKTQKRLYNETKELIRNKIDNLEKLHDDDVADLLSLISSLYTRTKQINNLPKKLCSVCNNPYLSESLYCNKCGRKII